MLGHMNVMFVLLSTHAELQRLVLNVSPLLVISTPLNSSLPRLHRLLNRVWIQASRLDSPDLHFRPGGESPPPNGIDDTDDTESNDGCLDDHSSIVRQRVVESVWTFKSS